MNKKYTPDEIDKLIEWLIGAVKKGYVKQENAIDFVVGKNWAELEQLKLAEENYA